MTPIKMTPERIEAFLRAIEERRKPEGSPQDLNRFFSILSRALHIEKSRVPAIREMRAALNRRKNMELFKQVIDQRQLGRKQGLLGREFKSTPQEKRDVVIWREHDQAVRERAAKLADEIEAARKRREERERLARLRETINNRRAARRR